MQQLTIAGNVGKDATLRKTQAGDAVLSFSMAVDNGKDKQGNKRDATWFDCSIWGKRAESLERHITKGSKLVVSGRPTAREYQGKVYLGVSVNELTFMGGGQQDYGHDARTAEGYPDDRQQMAQRDMDDEIPF